MCPQALSVSGVHWEREHETDDTIPSFPGQTGKPLPLTQPSIPYLMLLQAGEACDGHVTTTLVKAHLLLGEVPSAQAVGS